MKEFCLNIELFKVIDNNGQIYYGCDQAWYKDEWQKRAGCGPSVASNIILYLKANNKIYSKKDEVLLLMQECWDNVTPGEMGIPSTKIFCEAMDKYLLNKFPHKCLDVVENNRTRPDISEIISFIEYSLKKDSPVAFLNLCNGNEVALECWHWVTIISCKYDENLDVGEIGIIDQGTVKKINLLNWYNSTTRGGGFVYFLKK